MFILFYGEILKALMIYFQAKVADDHDHIHGVHADEEIEHKQGERIYMH